jgi:hypothetical protein
MKAAEDRTRSQALWRRGEEGSTSGLVGHIRTPLAEALVWTSVVEVGAELVEEQLQVVMTADENVVEAFASNRADEPLDVAVGLGRPDGGADDSDAGAFGYIIEEGAELGIVVAQEELGSFAERGQLAKLLCEPRAARSGCGDGSEDTPGLEVHDDEDEMAAEEEITDLEEVATPDAGCLVLEEG